MAKKRKSRPRKDYGDDIMDVVKLGVKANIGIGLLNSIGSATKK